MGKGLSNTFELAFAIGAKLDQSFRAAHGEASSEIAKLSVKSAEAMKMTKLKKEFNDSLNEFQGKAAEMGAAWQNVVDKIIGPIAKIAAVGAGVGAAIYGLAIKTGQMGDEAMKSASKIGITAESYSKMAFAARQSGLSTEQFSSNMTRLNNIMQKQIVKGQTDLFINGKRIYQLRDENKQVKDKTRILLESADAFSKLTDENEKARFATYLFGKSGADMIPMLESGSAGITKLMGDAERIGIVFDDTSGKRAVNFMDSLGELKASAQGLAISIGTQLHEPLQRVNEAVTNWIVNNRELIAQKVGEYIQQVVTWVKENKDGIIGLKDSVVEFIGQVSKWIDKNGGLIETLKMVGKWFLLIKGIGIAFSIMSAVTATATFILSVVTLAGKVGLLIAKFGGLKGIAVMIGKIAARFVPWIAILVTVATVVYKIYKNWDDLVYFFKNLGQTIPIFINDMVDEIKGIFGILPNWLQGVLTPIKNIIVGPFEAVQSLLQGDFLGFFMNLGKSILSYIYVIPSTIAHVGNEILKAIFGVDLIGAVKEWVSSLGTVMLEAFYTAIDYMVIAFPGIFIGMINDTIKGVTVAWQAIGGVFNSGIEYAKNTGLGIASAFSSAAIATRDAFGTAFSGISDFSRGAWNGIKGAWAASVQWFVDLGNGIKIVFTNAVSALQDIVNNVMGVVKDYFWTGINNIKEAFSGGFFNGIRDILNGIPQLFIKMLNDVVKTITGVDLLMIGKEWIQKFLDGILAAVRGAGDVIKSAVVGLIPDSVMGVLGGIGKVVGGAASTVAKALPQFGDGGIATSPSIVAEDGKPEMVIPMTKPRRAAELVSMLAPKVPELQVIREAGTAMSIMNGTARQAPETQSADKSPDILTIIKSAMASIDRMANSILSTAMASMDRMMSIHPAARQAPETQSADKSPLNILREAINNNTTNNVGGNTFNFTPSITVNVTGGVETSTIKTAVTDAMMDVRDKFETWYNQMERNKNRVAIA